MASKKQTALRLRLQGKSYTEIQKSIGNVSKSTLSLLLRDVIVPERVLLAMRRRTSEASRESLLKHSRMQTHKARQRVAQEREESAKKIGSLSSDKIFLVGI